MKILPELLKSIEFGGGGPKVFNVVMKIGTKLTDDEYESMLNPVIIRLFASPDRQIRVCLLDNLPQMIDHLSQKTVTDKIFPHLVRASKAIVVIRLCHQTDHRKGYRFYGCGPCCS
jgi:SCY1-like protein 1